MKKIILSFGFLIVFMLQPTVLMAQNSGGGQDAAQIEDIIAVDVEINDVSTITQWGVLIARAVAIASALTGIVIFIRTVLSVMSDNEEDATGRRSKKWGRLGSSFILLVILGAAAVLLWYGAPLISTLQAPT